MFFSCSEISCNLTFRSGTLTFIQYTHCHEPKMNFFKLLLFSLLCVSSSIVSTAPIAFQPVHSSEFTLKPCTKLPAASQYFIFDSLDYLESGDHQSLQNLKSLLQDTCKNTLAAKQARKTTIVTTQLTCTEENVSVVVKLTARKTDGVIHTMLMLFVPEKTDKEVIKAFEIFCRKVIPSLSMMQKHSGKIWGMTILTTAAIGAVTWQKIKPSVQRRIDYYKLCTRLRNLLTKACIKKTEKTTEISCLTCTESKSAYYYLKGNADCGKHTDYQCWDCWLESLTNSKKRCNYEIDSLDSTDKKKRGWMYSNEDGTPRLDENSQLKIDWIIPFQCPICRFTP